MATPKNFLDTWDTSGIEMDTESEITISQKKRSAPRYWVEKESRLYARLQYKTDNGKYKVKYKSISDKRTAKRVVDDMRR